jgi:hypothetical protein
MKTFALYISIVFAILVTGCSPASVTTAILTETDLTTSIAEGSVESTPMAAGTEGEETVPAATEESAQPDSYVVVDTGQGACYDESGIQVDCPGEGGGAYGQDAQYAGNQPAYLDNGDGTVSDLNTGLMWSQSPDLNGDGEINAADKFSYEEALSGASGFDLAGYTDWRLPTIKELYSLIVFDGVDPSGLEGSDTAGLIPFIDTEFFDFGYGDTSSGERIIDAQFATSTKYVSTTMNGNETMFGVNFADGRIKGYPTGSMPGSTEDKGFYVLYVRGNSAYGINDFVDNGDGTISDLATGLTWMQEDSGDALNWGEALNYCETLDYAGYDDWRLPDVKELQSIVDYTRSPDTTGSAAIDPLFESSSITDEAGQPDYAFYWSSTTHVNMRGGMNAAYVAFGRATGYMGAGWLDVHGAGAQRSDPKTGDPGAYPMGHGPQGDAIRIYNYARCVRDGEVSLDPDGDPGATRGGMAVEDTSDLGTQPEGPAGQGSPSGAGDPPAEAVVTCSGLYEGDSCSMNTPNGDMSGTCTVVPTGQLACVPDGAQTGP